MDEPASKKPKMNSDLEGSDGLSELEGLDPLPRQSASTPQTMQSPMNPGMSCPPSSQGPPSASQGGPPSIGAQPFHGEGAPQGGGPPSSQPSVLQELLLNPTSASSTAMNSPRAPFQNASFPNRSPMQPGSTMLSPPGPTQQMQGPPGQGRGAPVQGMRQQAMYPEAMGQPMQQAMINPNQMMTAQGQYAYIHPQQRPMYMAAQGRGAPMGRGMVPNGTMARGAMRGAQHMGMQQPMMMRQGMMPPAGYDPAAYMQRNDAYMQQVPQYNGMMGRPPQYPQGQQMMPGANPMMSMMDMPVHANAHPHMRPGGPPGQMPNGAPPPQQQRPPQMPTAAQPAQDPEKRKLIQQQLVLLLHAHKCQQREQAPGGCVTCTLPHCSTMKEVLRHMTTCNNGRQCNFAHCASSRQIIAHWKNCNRDDCPVCKPLKTIQATNPGSQQPPRLHDLGDMSNLLPGPSQHGGPPSNNAPMENMFSPSVPSSSSALLNDYHPQRYLSCPLLPTDSHPFRSPNPPNKMGRIAGKGGSDEFAAFPPPEMPNTQKEWHNDVTRDLRNHLVGKLVKAIFPSPDPAAMHDQRIKDLIQYARKVEKEMFETADDREEYYHLLAEKIYKIQKELQEKKQKRLSEQHTYKPGGGGGTPSSSTQFNFEMDFSRPMGSQQAATPQAAMQWPSTSQQSAMPATPDRRQSFPPSADNSQSSISSAPLIKHEPADSPKPSNGATTNGTANTPQVKEEVCEQTASTSTPTKAPDPAATQVVKKEPKRETTPPRGEEHVVDADELRRHLKPVWERLEQADDSVPFRMPVDPQLLNIPDYFEIVKHPMDLSTIRAKLDNGDYRNPWEFCDDMWLMFENAWLYNRKNSKVYKYSTKLSELFIDLVNPVMEKMGYCCGQKLNFTPLSLFCYGASMCTIARDQPYLCYETCSSQFGVTVSDRYTYCQKCFDALPEEGINLSENPNDTSNMVPKSEFKLLKNNQIDFEPFENCKYCGRKLHKICALYDKKVFPEGLICQTCRTEKSMPKPENKFTAKRLPHNKLSTFLEDRVNRFITSQVPVLNLKETHEVVIRVLSSSDKEVEVKPQMNNKYGPAGFPAKFPYRTKAIFAFEVIDGVEVCFFGLHVQEYGSNCPQPNQRRVYIAYLDSVHFFQPRQLRTDVYHEILLGYLDYARKLGYSMAHIWACPPSEGDDYIFHCHPPEQKIPKPKRLQDWYKKMLEKGIGEQCVVEYKDIFRQAKDDNLTTPMSLPYFEGDFWPNVIEDCIKEANQEEQTRKKVEAAEEDGEEEDIFQTSDNGKKKSSKNKKNNLKKSNTKNKKKQGSITGNEVADKLFSQFEKHKEVFFTIRLVSQQSELSLNADIVDPDPLMASELMDGRDTFLTRARDEHWEFSSLRRAKYSTICFCHALHDQESSKGIEYTCNKCNNTNARWHCNTCEDYDLCDTCKQTEKHQHQLEPIKTLMDDYSRPGNDAGSTRYESIQRCINSLVHACACRDANCHRMSCHKMKRVVQHTKMCKKRANASCPVCKQLIALCCYHAKHCTKDNCPVPFCMNIRQKLQEQKRCLARRADMMMRRRMEGLNHVASNASSAVTATAPSTSAAPPPSAAAPPSSAKGLPQQHQPTNQQQHSIGKFPHASPSFQQPNQMQHMGAHMGGYQQQPMGMVHQQQHQLGVPTSSQQIMGAPPSQMMRTGQQMAPGGRGQGAQMNPPPAYAQPRMHPTQYQNMMNQQMGMHNVPPHMRQLGGAAGAGGGMSRSVPTGGGGAPMDTSDPQMAKILARGGNAWQQQQQQQQAQFYSQQQQRGQFPSGGWGPGAYPQRNPVSPAVQNQFGTQMGATGGLVSGHQPPMVPGQQEQPPFR